MTKENIFKGIKTEYKRTKSLDLCLELAFAAGWDSHRNSIYGGNAKAITCLDESKVPIRAYPSVSNAARILHCNRATIHLHLVRGTKSRLNHYWEYADS